ncbi:MAG: tetratricopeptide repeat protein [Desulfofustis sp.]|nr:tetratricopeptide repeat protein [Desulfofustis sp.]
MATENNSVGKQTFYITIAIVFIAGFLSGVTFTIFKSGGAPGASSPGVAQQQVPADLNNQEILTLEAEVTARPDNYNAWTKLGHLYFDTDQPKKAIGAYTKSLSLHTGDANLWTDLGVMYRRDGDSGKALEIFEKASAMEPAHQPSRFNKGIVLHFDFGRSEEALATWDALLAMNPNYQTGNGTPLKELVEQIKNELKNKSAK